MTLLRPGLLEGRSIALAGALPREIEERLSSLGAQSLLCGQADEEQALEWARDAAAIDGLVCGSGALETVEETWAVVRAVANGALIAAGAGTIVLLAPRPDDVPHAEAVRAALENLARTLSVEWARYGITITALSPGAKTKNDDVATLVAFLCSPAGGYYSGCRFELDSLR